MHSFENNSSNVPAFLVKLWKLVEDPSCNDLIAWSDTGTSFIIRDQSRFSKELLPLYFKHNNMASFIRQLNMYDFHKVMNYEKSGLRNEGDEMEFQHHFFLKGQSVLLEHIKRKIPNAKVSSAPAVKSNARDILTDLSSIREKQENMDNMLLKMKQENELLWRELTSMRQKHKAQEQIIQKVIQFLVSIVQQSNQNIGVGVQGKMARMLQDSPGNKGKSKVTCTFDVLRNNNPNFITVDQDKTVSPLGPVIHEVTEFDHEQEENVDSPDVMSPEDKTDDGKSIPDAETPESECPLNSSLNSPIDTSANMEPLSILEPLQHNTSVLNTDNCCLEESVLGLPLECLPSPSNIISVSEESCDNVISLPENSNVNISLSYIPNQEMSIYTSAKSDFDDSMSESLHTPLIPTLHIEDICPSPINSEKNEEVLQQFNVKNNMNNTHNEHDYQLALSDSSSVVKPPTLAKNTLSNHVLNVEEDLKWLQDQISSNAWNIDPNKLLGLFNTDDVVNNEALAQEIAAQANIKTEPIDIIGNELVQFTPSMLEIELDNNQFLECLNQESQVCMGTASKNNDTQKNVLLVDALSNTDQTTASEAAEYLLNNRCTTKHKSPQHPKLQKLQKAKRRKIT